MKDQRLLIAVDVDGTLVNTELHDGLRGPEIRAAHLVRDAGHILALCTGRSARSAERVIRSSGNSLTGVPQILLNGALVINGGDGHILRSGGLEREMVSELVQMFREAGTMPMTFDMQEDGGGLRVENSEPNPVLGRYLDLRRTQIGHIDFCDDLTATIPAISQEVGTIDLQERAVALADQVKKRFGDRVWVVSTQTMIERETYQWIEVMPPHCNKGTGLEILAQELGVAKEDTVAIGDNYNDLDMFLVAGHSVAMGNAPADVKRSVDRVTAGVADHGAALILEEIARGEWPSRQGDGDDTSNR